MSEQPYILVVEDDPSIGRVVQLELEHAGYDVTRVEDGTSAVDTVAARTPDLVVLDLMLPGIDGLEVARRIRAETGAIPILMLTARAETADAVAGFEAGADDYVRKPFEMPELMSRIKALLKRTGTDAGGAQILKASGVEIDVSSRRATVNGEAIDLTAKQYDLLAYLVQHAGRVIPRDEILGAVWGSQHSTDSNVIEVFVCHLRNKIGDKDNAIIQTIRGVGYFFAKG